MSFGFGLSLPAYPLRGGGGNNPFNQSGPTLDMSFAGVVTDNTDPNGYTLTTNFITPQYQVAAQYTIWETGVGLVDKTFSQIITFTRASTGTYFNASGVLTSAANDVPRLDYDPSTLAAQGLLIEEARTNSIRNNTMVGAVAGTPGTAPTNWSTFTSLTGLTRTIVGTGTENGITYIDIRLSGTPSASGVYLINVESATQNAASNGQSWSGSTYCKLQSGSLTGVSSITLRTAALDVSQVELTNTSQIFTPTSAALNTQRTVASHTNTSASTAYEIVYFRVALSGAAIDITLRIGLPQLELGAFATSVIPTTTTALTRSTDVASVNTLSPWYNATEGTLFTESQQAQDRTAGFPIVAGISDSAAGVNTIEHYWTNSTSSLGGLVYVSSVIQANITVPGLTRTNSQKVAFAYKANDFAGCINGGAVGTDTSGTIPVVDRLAIGSRPGGGSSINGYLRRITYYPRRLSNAELQSITA